MCAARKLPLDIEGTNVPSISKNTIPRSVITERYLAQQFRTATSVKNEVGSDYSVGTAVHTTRARPTKTGGTTVYHDRSRRSTKPSVFKNQASPHADRSRADMPPTTSSSGPLMPDRICGWS